MHPGCSSQIQGCLKKLLSTQATACFDVKWLTRLFSNVVRLLLLWPMCLKNNWFQLSSNVSLLSLLRSLWPNVFYDSWRRHKTTSDTEGFRYHSAEGRGDSKACFEWYWGRLCPYQGTRSTPVAVDLLIHALILPQNKHLSLCCRTKNDLHCRCNAYLLVQ